MGQRIHAIFMYLNPLTFERSIVIGGKHDRLIPMGTGVTPKPPVCVGKVVRFNFLKIICVEVSAAEADADILRRTRRQIQIRTGKGGRSIAAIQLLDVATVQNNSPLAQHIYYLLIIT